MREEILAFESVEGPSKRGMVTYLCQRLCMLLHLYSLVCVQLVVPQSSYITALDMAR